MDRAVLSLPIDFYYAGHMRCKPGHQHGPAVRDHCLIHYIHSGRGEYEVDGTSYKLGQGSGFLIGPGIRFRYKADREEPWVYTWVAFRGEQTGEALQQVGLNRRQPIFYYNQDDRLEQCLKMILSTAKEESPGKSWRQAGWIYALMGLLAEAGQPEFQSGLASSERAAGRSASYVSQAMEYMYTHYMRTVTIAEIARHVSLNRRYLTRLFKERLHRSPHEMLLQIRMRKACELMLQPELNIGDIARSVGYEDPMRFSKVFKQVHRASPSEYRTRVRP